jgi:hypothetical protein
VARAAFRRCGFDAGEEVRGDGLVPSMMIVPTSTVSRRPPGR